MSIKQKLFSETSARDEAFNDALSYLSNGPANILEIGCLRDLNSRAGDGWSTLHWANYVEKNGGYLTVIDINQESLDLCRELVNNFAADAAFICDKGENHVNNSYDFVYLDGGVCPHEALAQFEKCDLKTQIVLMDDFHTKGVIVDEKYSEKLLFRFSNGHKMALYGRGVKAEEKFIQV
jgi:predicted O-methyltransferase YrrM